MIVKVKNKGFFIAKTTLIYKKFSNEIFDRITKSIVIGQEHVFKISFNKDLSSLYLVVHAVAGVQIMAVKIHSNPSCFHVWGTTLNPYWTSVNCR